MTVYLILALLFAVAVATFAVANTDAVTINFIFDQLKMSLALVIIGSAAAGALAVGIVSMVRQVGLRLRVWDRENRSRRYEKESLELKNENTSLAEQVAKLQDELSENEAYAAHLEELLRQRGQDIEALQRARASQPLPETVAETEETEPDEPAEDEQDPGTDEPQ